MKMNLHFLVRSHHVTLLQCYNVSMDKRMAEFGCPVGGDLERYLGAKDTSCGVTRPAETGALMPNPFGYDLSVRYAVAVSHHLLRCCCWVPASSAKPRRSEVHSDRVDPSPLAGPSGAGCHPAPAAVQPCYGSFFFLPPAGLRCG